jgi:predicted dehydrogenase
MIVLVGCGGMARDYASVLKALQQPVKVVGRGAASAQAFEQATQLPVIHGGLQAALAAGTLADARAAIVAVGVEALCETTAQLIGAGVRRILVEKPAGLDAGQVQALHELAQARGAQVFVAYNRRFYSSVRQARRMLQADGGVQSCIFEFTEWSHVIGGLVKAEGVKERWLLGNSSHVIDLAFFVAGSPVSLQTQHAGALPWHPAASRFVGCGRTEHGVLFSYHANWEAPGRWAVEFCSANQRLILKPMEALQLVRKGSVAVEPVEVEGAELDQRFKPGLFLQTQAFLDGDDADLCPLSHQARAVLDYSAIAGYEAPRSTATY